MCWSLEEITTTAMCIKCLNLNHHHMDVRSFLIGTKTIVWPLIERNDEKTKTTDQRIRYMYSGTSSIHRENGRFWSELKAQ